MVKSYKLVKGTFYSLPGIVNGTIKKGWQPHGNAFLIVNEYCKSALDRNMGFPGEPVLCQPIVMMENEIQPK